jgi:cysteine desulfurase
VGFARALELAQGDTSARGAENARLAGLRDRLLAGIRDLEGVEPTGHPIERLPHSASWLIDGVEGGDLVAALDLEGVEGSTGSACTSGSAEPSHVLLAMGIDPARAHGALRLTAGRGTTLADVQRAIEVLRSSIGRIREQTARPSQVASA